MTTIGGELALRLRYAASNACSEFVAYTPSSYIDGGNIPDNGNIDISNWDNVRAVLVWCQKVLH